MKINDNRNLDIELKCGLEEYLMEDIDRQLEGFRNLDEPPYSEEYKKFVQNFFKRKKSLRKMQWKRRSGIAAIFICFCIFNNIICSFPPNPLGRALYRGLSSQCVDASAQHKHICAAAVRYTPKQTTQ